ncbi:28S ribosomal protein S15 [Nesidiocoris tenuis]|nr:28S ribosomal protein S15 [Nesidiocoris tenuis]
MIMRRSRDLLSCSTVEPIFARNLSLSSVNLLKSNLPFKWVRPEKISCNHPLRSGDLRPIVKLDLTKVRPLEFQDSEELKTADDRVQRLFTLEYFPLQKTKIVLREMYKSSVKRHALDDKSPESRISRMTANIRMFQEHMERFPHDVAMKVRLKESIDKRKRLLLQLREKDYRCFEWLLEKLDLEYKPFPPKTVYMRVERKRSLRMLTKEYCDNIVKEKLDGLKKQFEERKESFLQDKIDKLKWIMKEEKECGVAPTVTENDIAAAEKQLEEIVAARVAKEEKPKEM